MYNLFSRLLFQEQIKITVNQLNKFEEMPLDSIKDNLYRLIDLLKCLTKKTKNILVRVRRLVMSLGENIMAYDDMFCNSEPESVQVR